MKRKFSVVIAMLMMTNGACFGATPQTPQRKGEFKLVYRVEEVIVRVMESFPEQLHIEARGKTRTGGWTDAQLRPVGGTGSNGVYEFRFVARAPTSFATQALTPVSATHTMQKPKTFRSVRVIAETNSKDAG